MKSIKQLEEQYDELQEEIEDNIEDANDNGYDYTKTNEFASKRRQQTEIYNKINVIKLKKENSEGFSGKYRNNFGGVFG